jgi:hypothetical protein
MQEENKMCAEISELYQLIQRLQEEILLLKHRHDSSTGSTPPSRDMGCSFVSKMEKALTGLLESVRLLILLSKTDRMSFAFLNALQNVEISE